MTYTRDIPISGDSLGSTRDRIRTNFQVVDTDFAVNHIAFNSSGAGKHKYVEMPVTTVPATLATEGSLYTKAAGQTQLFYTSDAGAQEYQLTRAIDANIATFGTLTNYPPAVVNQNGGWTFLPGGLILQYGSMVQTTNSNVGTPVVFPIAFSSFVASVSAIRLQNASGTASGVSNVSLTGFNYTADGSSLLLFYWTAIGK